MSGSLGDEQRAAHFLRTVNAMGNKRTLRPLFAISRQRGRRPEIRHAVFDAHRRSGNRATLFAGKEKMPPTPFEQPGYHRFGDIRPVQGFRDDSSEQPALVDRCRLNRKTGLYLWHRVREAIQLRPVVVMPEAPLRPATHLLKWAARSGLVEKRIAVRRTLRTTTLDDPNSSPLWGDRGPLQMPG